MHAGVNMEPHHFWEHWSSGRPAKEKQKQSGWRLWGLGRQWQNLRFHAYNFTWTAFHLVAGTAYIEGGIFQSCCFYRKLNNNTSSNKRLMWICWRLNGKQPLAHSELCLGSPRMKLHPNTVCCQGRKCNCKIRKNSLNLLTLRQACRYAMSKLTLQFQFLFPVGQSIWNSEDMIFERFLAGLWRTDLSRFLSTTWAVDYTTSRTVRTLTGRQRSPVYTEYTYLHL